MLKLAAVTVTASAGPHARNGDNIVTLTKTVSIPTTVTARPKSDSSAQKISPSAWHPDSKTLRLQCIVDDAQSGQCARREWDQGSSSLDNLPLFLSQIFALYSCMLDP